MVFNGVLTAVLSGFAQRSAISWFLGLPLSDVSLLVLLVGRSGRSSCERRDAGRRLESPKLLELQWHVPLRRERPSVPIYPANGIDHVHGRRPPRGVVLDMDSSVSPMQRRGLNDISVLSKSCYGRSLNRGKAVIWRMSVDYAPLKYVADLYRAAGAEVYNI